MALTQVKTLGIADDAVTGAKIADDTVAEANMANDAISLAELKAGTDGQIISWDASGNPVAIGPGSDGQVLTSTGAGSPPAFAAVPAGGATINNATENELVTVASTTTQLDAEANLTYDGNNLQQSIDAAGEGIRIKATGDHWTGFYGNSNRSSADVRLVSLLGQWNDTTVGGIHILSGADTTNKDDGRIAFHTSVSDGSDPVERMRIDDSGRVMINTTSAENADSMLTIAETSGHCEVNIRSKNDSGAVLNFGDPEDYNIGRMKYDHAANEFQWDVNNTHRLSLESGGDLNIEDGNLKVASGHGIDFSATAGPAAGSGTQELLDDYEEGTWTPEARFNDVAASGQSSNGHYVKIGRMVFASYRLTLTNKGTGDGQFHINGAPFAPMTGYSDIASGLGYSHRFADTDNTNGQVEAQFYSSIIYLAFRGLNANTTRLTDDNLRDDCALSGMIVYYTTA